MKKLLLSVFALTAYVGVNAQCTELFISEYVEGSGNDKAIEIYNPTANPVNLAAYKFVRYSNGSTTASDMLQLSGTIAPYDVFVITNGQTTGGATSPPCSPALQLLADQLDGAYPAPTYMNGDDALTLEKNGVIVDVFGKIGEDPGASWSDVFPFTDASGTWWTKDHTLKRKAAITQGVTTSPSAFDVTIEWDSLPQNTWSGLGIHTCSCGTASIKDIANNNSNITVYPNPANNNYFNVNASEVIEIIEVYNMVGQNVLVKEGNNINKRMFVETGNLAKGVYFIKASFANNKSSVIKLSIQ